MPNSPKSNLPRPPVLSFLLCREIFTDERTRESILIGPRCMYPVSELPATIVMSASIFVGGGHGQYRIGLSLRDANDDEVWGCEPPEPVEHPDPLMPHLITMMDLQISVRDAGRHQMVVLINGEEVLQSPFIVIPPAEFDPE